MKGSAPSEPFASPLEFPVRTVDCDSDIAEDGDSDIAEDGDSLAAEDCGSDITAFTTLRAFPEDRDTSTRIAMRRFSRAIAPA
jgi:hypothetical protein